MRILGRNLARQLTVPVSLSMSSLDFGVGSLRIASIFFGSGFKSCAVSKCPIKSTSCTLRASVCSLSLIDF